MGLTGLPGPQCAGCGAAPLRRNAPDPGNARGGTTRTASGWGRTWPTCAARAKPAAPWRIAAAGGHNLIMIGSPGTGKSMLAKRLPGILPPLTYEEALETSAIYSVAGLLRGGTGLSKQRPFRSPHHSVSSTAISGRRVCPRPARSVWRTTALLFLDELPEFARDTLGCCASRWRTARLPSAAYTAQRPTGAGSCWWPP